MSNHIRNAERAHMNTYVPSLFIVVTIASLILDFFFPSPLYTVMWTQEAGFIFLFLGSILLYAAHRSAKTIRKDITTSNDSVVDFFVGPYQYMRHPAYMGMVLVGIGMSFLLNSGIILLSSALFYLIARVVVRMEEEHLLHEDSHLNHHYKAYTKKVKRFF